MVWFSHSLNGILVIITTCHFLRKLIFWDTRENVFVSCHVLRRTKAHGEHLPRYKSQQATHLSEWVLVVFLLCCLSSEKGSWCSSLVHIHCIYLHGQPWVMVNLWPLCICMVAPCSWCGITFYAKVHIIFQWRGSSQPLSDPLVYTSHFLHFQWWLLHLRFLL